MSSTYELVGEGGDTSPRETPERPMIVRLYPATAAQVPACEDGGIAAESVLDAGEQLYEYGSVDYYAVYRYRTERDDLEPPADAVDWEDVARGFRSFLRRNDGAGENLYDYRGVHQLIHEGPSGCIEDADGYAPDGAGAEFTQATAFGTGVVAWSPLCGDEGLTRNATMQEAVHCFLHHDAYDRSLTGSERDEHTLGRVTEAGVTTPMLTYHWDDDLGAFDGACPSALGRATGHTQRLTECTRLAVAQTAVEKADVILG